MTRSKTITNIYPISISSVSTIAPKHEVLFWFSSVRAARGYIRSQAKRKGMTLHYGCAYNNTIEMCPLC